MKVKNFTHLWCCLLLSCMFAIPQMSFSQSGPTLACNDNVQISLNSDCEGITPDMLLEGEIGSIGNTMTPNFIVDIGALSGATFFECQEFGMDSNGDGVINQADFDLTMSAPPGGLPCSNPPINPLNLGSIANSGPVTYMLTETSTGNSCWGTVTVELNLLPEFDSPCAIGEDGMITCSTYCSEDDQPAFPAGFVSIDDIRAMIARGCFLDITGEINVVTESSGDACSGTTIISYFANVDRHGVISKELLLTQGFTTMGLDPAVVMPPTSFIIDCDELSQEASPAEIFAATGSGTQSFPHFADVHSQVPDSLTFEAEFETLVPVDTTEVLTPIELADGSTVWVLLPVVNKEVEVTEVSARWPIDTNGNPICMDDGMCVPCVLTSGDAEMEFPIGDCMSPAFTNPLVFIQDGSFCNLITSFSDAGPFEACGSGFKIIRTWSVIDWCDATAGAFVLDDLQFIEVSDTEAPEIGDIDDDVVSIDPWTCTASFEVPLPDAEDGCDGSTIDFQVNVSHGIFDPESGFIVGLPLTGGTPVVIDIDVSDDCGNSDATSFELTVIDLVAPVPVCNNNLTVTLTGTAGGGGGVAKIQATDFDAGSNDAGCGPVTITAARMTGCCDTEGECAGGDEVCLAYDKFGECIETGVTPESDAFGDFVAFCCEDAGQTVMVAVLVVDEFGNRNTCMVEVTVVDKSASDCVDDTVTISCLDDAGAVPAPGAIAAVCEGLVPTMISETVNDSGCGLGQIIREFSIDNDGDGTLSPGDAFCVQTINITGEGAFDPTTIRWPIHYNGEILPGTNRECDPDDELAEFDINVAMNPVFSCSAGVINDVPVWCDSPCGLVGFSVEDETSSASDACLTIIRRWTVIDWCTFDPNGSGVDDENDTSNEVFEPVEDWTNGTACQTCDEVSATNVYFRYDDGQFEEDGFYTFDQIIKVVDDTAPTITFDFDDTPVATNGGNTAKGQNVQCTGSTTFTSIASDACGGEDVGTDLLTWVVTREEPGLDEPVVRTGSGGSFTMGSGEGSPGDVHTITWRLTDGCGNSSTEVSTVTFGDSAAPTPLCISGVTTAFMEADGTVEIWAADFDLGSFDNCTADDDLVFTIGLSGTDAADATPNIGFSCDDQQTFFELDVFVTDINGNADFCTVGVLIGGECDGSEGGASAVIAGNIATQFGDMVDNAIVSVNGNAGAEFPKSTATEGNGEYSFNNNPLTFDYNLAAQRNDDFSNGVSTLDIVLIQKHILGLTPFTSPYSHLAADINNSGSITASDLVELRELILGRVNELSNNSSWRFVDAAQQFLDPSNPFPFNEVIDVNNLAIDMMTENFIGVKIGDLSADAVANQFMTTEIRSNGLLTLTAENAEFDAGQIVTVPVSSANFNAVAGYQFTLDHTGLELQNVTAGALEVTDANVAVNRGQLTMSWSEAQAVSSSDVLFTLVFKASSAGQLSTALNLNSSVTKAEAYIGNNLDRANVDLTIGSTALVSTFDLYQNSPNPFDEETVIGFNLPDAGTAKLTVYDVTGKTVMSMNGNYSKGYNEIVLTRAQVATGGILYYELESGDNSATRKMIVIE